ncbi:MAG: M61 family metallopeptidase [Formosimonas sp.]
MNPTLHYTVTPLMARNVFAIRLQIAACPAEFELYLPTWITGSYMLRDFARHVVRIESNDAQLTPLTQSSWRVNCHGSVTIDYEVYAHDTSVRTAFLDSTGGFFNGTSLFLSAPCLADAPHRVTLVAPEAQADWQVASTLPAAPSTASRGFGDYVAANYDELVDHPVRMGCLTWLTFNVANTPHEVAIAGHVPHLAGQLLVADLERICAAQIELFGGVAPFARYLFMVDARGEGYGGLEHRDSTALLCRRQDLPTHLDEIERRDDYLTFLGLCSHEYFHAWNVKRIKPAAFVNYDLTQTIDTSLLWFFEGVTSYYDDLILRRTEILSEAQYFKRLNTTLNAVLRHDGARVQSAHDSGFYAWSKYYQTSPNTPNAVVSYYAKGSLIALVLDFYLQAHSSASLDDVMRDLWHEFGQNFAQEPHGVTLDDIVRACTRYAPAIEPILLSAVHSTDDLPLDELLATQNISLKRIDSPAQLGASVSKTDGGYAITRVFNNGAAQKAQLAPDDILLAVDTLKLTATPDEVLAQYPLGQAITVHFWRDGVLSSTVLVNQTGVQPTVELVRNTTALS